MHFGNGESVKRTRHGQSVSPHVLEYDPVAQLHFGQQNILDHVIQTVASRPPNAAGIQLLSAVFLQRLRHDVLMVVQDAVEAAVNAVVDVVHVVFGRQARHVFLDGHGTNGMDAAGQSVRGTDVETSGFGYDLDGGIREEVL